MFANIAASVVVQQDGTLERIVNGVDTGTDDDAINGSSPELRQWTSADFSAGAVDSSYGADGGTPAIADPENLVGKIGAAVTVAMISAGIVGNVLVLVVIQRCPRLRRSYNAFIASLSVTDLIFNVCIMPFYVDTYVHRTWRFSDDLCRFHTYFGTMTVMSSSLHIGLIAFNRYVLIVQPQVRFCLSWYFMLGAASIVCNCW